MTNVHFKARVPNAHLSSIQPVKEERSKDTVIPQINGTSLLLVTLSEAHNSKTLHLYKGFQLPK